MTGRPRSCECGVCKTCKKREYMARWYAKKTPEQRKAWVARRDRATVQKNDRARYERDKEKRLAAQREWYLVDREANPEKWKARYTVSNAVRDGRMERPALCAACSSGGSIEAHHRDYSNPLDVEWLCPKCHGERHQLPF